MRLSLLALATMALTACGNQAGRTVTSPPSAGSPSAAASSASSQASPLFAILETRRTGGQESEYAGSHDTIAIAGIDGYARAKATFTPRSVPQVAMAGAVLEPEAYIAAGGVYFIDGKGVVRRLDQSGAVRVVTTFPVSSPQQAASFAVSPDGKQLMAALLTYPTVVPNSSSNGPAFSVSGAWRLDLEAAGDGTAARLLHHWETAPDNNPGSATGFHNLVMAGWDDRGPLVITDSYPAAQQILFDGQFWAGGKLARLAADGTIGSPQGPTNCSPYRVDETRNVVCVPQGAGVPGRVDVARVDGSIQWTAPAFTEAGQPGGFALAPDRARLAMDGQVAARDGSRTSLPKDFLTRGWLDDRTIIGLIGTKVGVLDASSGKLDNWGFTGQFVGVLHA